MPKGKTKYVENDQWNDENQIINSKCNPRQSFGKNHESLNLNGGGNINTSLDQDSTTDYLNDENYEIDFESNSNKKTIEN